ncbi:MAG: hypothetical protein Kow00105_13450 [Phycisphaeraceae bacterium]
MPAILPIAVLILGSVMLAVVAWRGALRRDALTAGPSRRVGLKPADLLISLGLMIVGPACVGLILPQDPDPAQTDVVRWATRVLLVQIVGQGLPVAYMLIRTTSAVDGWRRLGVIPARPGRDVIWGFMGLLVAAPMVMGTIQATVLIGEIFGQEAPRIAHDMLKVMVNSDSFIGTVMLIFSALIVAPVLEEALFRGLVQTVMVETAGEEQRWGVVLTASFIFAIIHADTATFENWQALPGLFVLGVVLGWLYERSGSLLPGIVVHMGFNTINVVMALTVAPG